MGAAWERRQRQPSFYQKGPLVDSRALIQKLLPTNTNYWGFFLSSYTHRGSLTSSVTYPPPHSPSVVRKLFLSSAFLLWFQLISFHHILCLTATGSALLWLFSKQRKGGDILLRVRDLSEHHYTFETEERRLMVRFQENLSSY